MKNKIKTTVLFEKFWKLFFFAFLLSVYFETSGITVIDLYSNMVFETVVGKDI